MAIAVQRKIPFSDLPCHPAKIQKIILTLDSRVNGLWDLLMKRKELVDIGKEIRGDHPLKFLEAIFTHRECRQIMRDSVFPSCLKRCNFIGWVKIGKKGEIEGEGLNFGMYRGLAQKEVMPYLKEFAARVGTTATALKPLIREGAQKRDWTALVQHLIEVGPAREEQTSQA